MASKKRKAIQSEWLEENIIAKLPEVGLPETVKAALEKYKIQKAAAQAPSLPARSLNPDEVIKIFSLDSMTFLKHDEQFDVPSELGENIYLHQIQIRDRQRRTGERGRLEVFINLVILYCILEERTSVEEAAAWASAKSGRQAGALEASRPKTPVGSSTALGAQISLYMETELSRQVVYKGQPRMLKGIADYTLGYADAGAGGRHSANLIIVKSKRRWELDSAFGQLLAYMAIVHSARKEEKKDHAIVWGVATDGTRYTFWRIKNDSSVGMSMTFDWNDIEQRKAIYSTLRAITRAAVISSPTTSPLKGDLQEQFAEMFTTSDKHLDFQAVSSWDDIFVWEDDPDIEILDMTRA